MGPLVPCELVTGGRFLREIPGGTSLHFGGSRPKMKYSRYYFEYHKAQGQPAGWEPQYRETGKGATPCWVPSYKGIKYQSSVFTRYAAWGAAGRVYTPVPGNWEEWYTLLGSE